ARPSRAPGADTALGVPGTTAEGMERRPQTFATTPRVRRHLCAAVDPAKRDGGRRTAAARRDRTGMGRNLGRALWTGARRTAAGTAGNRRVVAHALSGKSQASTDARSSRDTQRPGPESGGLSRAVREPARPGRR